MQKRLLWLAALAVLAWTAAAPAAATRPNYHYGEMWWREYANDENTTLLLHFGRPQAKAGKQLAEAVQEKEKQEKIETDLVDLDELDEPENDFGGGIEIEKITPETMGPPPVDDADVPPGVVLDYSDDRKRLELGDGASLVAQGRFGEGLALDGSAGQTIWNVRIGSHGSIEFWVRPDRLPAAGRACILAVNKDETRLLLRPDGRLELALRKPHGVPHDETTEEELARILARDASIVTPDPIPVGEWTHIVVFNKNHVVQGSGPPFDATVKVNGADQANYLSENGNAYFFLGRRSTNLSLGDSFAGGEGFAGRIDELRVCEQTPYFYERPPLPWRDAELTREVRFDRPWFREDATVFHVDLDHGLEYRLDRAGSGGVELDLKGESIGGLAVPGIRGQGWVLRPSLAFPRFPLQGLSAVDGAVEFWLRPVNWDDVTGYWHHTPPRQPRALSVARFYARDTRDGTVRKLMEARLPRCHNRERSRVPVDPGHWLHCVVNWHDGWRQGGNLFVNGRRLNRVWRATELIDHAEPLYVEFGVSDEVTVDRDEAPVIVIDEVVGYRLPLDKDEVAQARRRWQGELEPIDLFADRLEFKYSLQRLEYALTPKLPAGRQPRRCTVRLLNGEGEAMGEPVEADLTDGRFFVRLWDETPLPEDDYTVAFTIANAAGETLLEDERAWHYEEEPWRHYQGGVIDYVPEPWTPLQVSDTAVESRMSRWVLGPDGLARAIHADGVDLLAGPMELREGGTPLAGEDFTLTARGETGAAWRARFPGASCEVKLACAAEYDGMVKFTLRIEPSAPGGTVRPLTLAVPIKGELATRMLYYPMGARGPKTGVIPPAEGVHLASRWDPVPYAEWKAYKQARRQRPELTWQAYWEPKKAAFKRFNFYGHVDINDMNRGLWWFCDNAAGWHQSPEKSAVEIVRTGDRVELRLNLVAAPTAYRADRPIVFAFLPHPARPLPEKYRLYDRVSPERDEKACSIFDAFRTWPQSPRHGGESLNMKLYPAVDPKNPEAGPSWAYAESCIPSMEANQPHGYRTLYLSKMWFSCRAGAYDNWEWRSGPSGGVSLTPYFVNYLTWEMNEWIGRGIWDAIYLDECYEQPARNLEAGFSVRLPDGSEQPGVTNFQFRELMKRWRNLFHQHGRQPMQIAHLTYSYQYHGVVFCDAYLDGENRPIVSLKSRDWIDSTSRTQFEVVQNGRLWGVTSFYMPFIAEGGFDDKTSSQFPVWQWRMARQAQSQFAHYETATVYEGQGAQVYDAYWQDLYRWGAGDPQQASFHPYWDNDEYLQVADQGGATLVSFYRRDGKVLLIASNRRREPVELRVELDAAALGLPEGFAARQWDSSFQPPPGEDYRGTEAAKQEAEELLEEAGAGSELLMDDGGEEMDLGALEDELIDPEEKAAQERAALAPRVEDGALILPVRPRDFRLIALE